MALLRRNEHTALIEQELRALRAPLHWRTVDALFLHSPVVERAAAVLAANRSNRGRNTIAVLPPWSLLSLVLWNNAKDHPYPLTAADVVAQAVAGSGIDDLYSLLCLFAILYVGEGNGQSSEHRLRDRDAAVNKILELFTGMHGTVESFSADKLDEQFSLDGSGNKRGLRGDKGPPRADATRRYDRSYRARSGQRWYYDYSARDDTTVLVPLAGHFVGDGRQDNKRLGVYSGQVRVFRKERGRLGFAGGSAATIRWLPEAAIDIAKALAPAADASANTRVDLNSLRKVFAKHLQGYCFISDWINDQTLRRGISLMDRAAIDAQLLHSMGDIRQAWAQYEEERPSRGS